MSGRAESRQMRKEGSSEVWRMMVSALAARASLALANERRVGLDMFPCQIVCFH